MRRIVYSAAKTFLLIGLLMIVLTAALPIDAERRSGGLNAEAEGMKEVLRLPLYHAPTGKATFVPGRLLVKFRSDVLHGQRMAHLAVEGLRIVDHLALLDVELVSVPIGQELDLAKELGHHPAIVYAEPDYVVYALAHPNDPYYALFQWNMPHIGLEGAWDTTTGAEDIVIAVIDSGVDLAHPDLAGKLVAGYDFVNDDSDPSDDLGHGTHVAGISAAATDNGVGVAGVSWGSKIMPVKVLASDGLGSSSDIAQGIQWAADHGADILNLSLGGETYSTTEANAVNYAYGQGCLVVAAAGNDFEDGNDTMYPAAFNHVLGVGAVDDANEHADYSNTGAYVDVVAPGGNPTSDFDPDPNHWIYSIYWQGSGHSYAQMDGTSMACPHVAGLAALLWSVNAALTNDEVSYIMTNTATDLNPPGRDNVYGWGVLEANAAVAAAAAGVNTPTPTITPTPVPAVWHRVALAGQRVRDIISQPGTADVLMACTEGSDLGVWVTTNAGGIWTQVSHGLVDPNIYKLAQEPGQPWTVYAASIDRLWKTTNGGQSWNYVPVREPPVSHLSGLATDPLYAGRLYLTAWEPCSTMFVSEDGGSSWDEHLGPDLCSYLPLDSSIEVSSVTSGTLYLARAHDSPTIYSSEDAGEQWELLTAIAGGELVNDLALDPMDDEHLYAATFASGVYVTDDGGTTWQVASYGLPGSGYLANVTALWVNPHDPAMVYAAVEGEGVYISRDGGGWWKAHGGGFPAGVTVYALYASPQRSGRLWAATDDGIWVIETYNCQLPLILKDAVGPATATPTVTATGTWTATPSATHTGGPTATVTSTPTPTLTPTTSNCYDDIQDGRFDWVDDVNWVRTITPRRAVYTTGEYHSWPQSMRMGIEPGEPIVEAYSSVYQEISIPPNATSATLSFWWQRHTEETPLSAMPLKPWLEGEMLPLSSLNYVGEDLHLVRLYDPSFYPWHFVKELEGGRANDPGWVEAVHDLMPYRGDTLILYFDAINDAYGGRTWMYVDDVKLEICLPGSP